MSDLNRTGKQVWPLEVNNREKDCELGTHERSPSPSPSPSKWMSASMGRLSGIGMGGRRLQNIKMQKIDAAFATNVLANERTLLAWIRTCIAIITFGTVLSRIIEKSGSVPVGAGFVIGGGAMAVVGAYLYTKRNGDLINDRRIRISNAIFVLVAGFTLVISVCVLVLLLR